MNDQRNKSIDVETSEDEAKKKLPFPKSIIFIVGNEFCERFSFIGMKGQ